MRITTIVTTAEKLSHAATLEQIAERGTREARVLGEKDAPSHINRLTPRLTLGNGLGAYFEA